MISAIFLGQVTQDLTLNIS